MNVFGKKEGASHLYQNNNATSLLIVRVNIYVVVGGVIGVGVFVNAWPLSGTRERRSSQTCSSKKRLPPFLSLDVAALCRRRLERL